MDNKKLAKNLIKMKTFHNLKCKTYQHEKVNTSKGIIRNRELSLKEIKLALEKQVFTDYIKITIKSGEEKIQTHAYILIFNKPIISQGSENWILPQRGITMYPCTLKVL